MLVDTQPATYQHVPAAPEVRDDWVDAQLIGVVMDNAVFSLVAAVLVVHAMTGERDSNTRPELAQRYVEALNAAGAKASFEIVGGEGHNSAFRSGATSAAVLRLVEDVGQP